MNRTRGGATGRPDPKEGELQKNVPATTVAPKGQLVGVGGGGERGLWVIRVEGGRKLIKYVRAPVLSNIISRKNNFFSLCFLFIASPPPPPANFFVVRRSAFLVSPRV